jgi:basic amino acid/polyamine antiporter, APA family
MHVRPPETSLRAHAMQNEGKGGKPLGFWMCTSLIVGNVIGMGIFMLPASLAPYGMNAFLGWGITVLGCIFIAHVFASLARALPREDGPYGYTRRAFGNGVAFFIMWCYWVSIWITNAALAIAMVGYLTALFPVLATRPMLAPAVALALIWFFVLVNTRGARTSGRVQMISTILKLLPMIAVMLLGAYLLFNNAHACVARLPSTPLSFEGTAAAGTIALFSMLGVECATIPAGKVDNPERTIARATMAGTLITAAIYIGVTAIPLLLIPQAELAQSNAPFVDLFKRYMSADAGQWLAIFVIVSGLGALNGWAMIAGEVTVSFASNWILPAAFKAQNSKGAPVLALLFCGLLSSAMVAMNYSRSLTQGFTFLSVMVTAANLPLYLIGGIALIQLWRRGIVRGAKGKAMFMLVSAVMATLYSVWAFYGVGQESFLWAIALGALSLPVFHGMRSWRKWRVIARSGSPV